MRLADFALAIPGKGQVAVQVRFAALNPIDWKLRNGQMKIVTGKRFPRAMGMDFSGTVIAVGPGVTRFQAGDAVFGLAPFKETGALGQAVVTSATSLASKPGNVSFEGAACLGTAGVTAWNGLADKAGLTAGMRVFVNGCAGAVGEAAVQIAQLLGATVAGSCSAGDMERARCLHASRGGALRTIGRDIATLQGIGADIDGEPGVGYILRPGFLLPPLSLTEEEVQALVAGAQWVSRQTDPALARAMQHALAKIAGVLPPAMRPALDDSAL
ncbi:alcohol dehydrogenase catalytic domain-containing protein [Massilia sp. P8910]|uniref:alcohol dehydrogenase catalytic domain-containing protein n=1 Tax=Massilia antarctica TaxID=2765360 RepID=UPI001E40716D|nr:alcohol dehydrogenase catalytic domain-containing protein [Massilia antarctica]MCE3606600.1 alcohol dehydrogenase catalytic domain-containing protein [Massilia antarctica]